MTRALRSATVTLGCVLVLAAPASPQAPDSTPGSLVGRSVRFETRAGAAHRQQPQEGQLVSLDADSMVVRLSVGKFVLPRTELLTLSVRCQQGKKCWEPATLPTRRPVDLSSLVGEWVRVRAAPGPVREGRVLGLDSGGLVLDRGGIGTVAIPPADIRELWLGTRIGNHSAEYGAKVGLASGAVAYTITFVQLRTAGIRTGWTHSSATAVGAAVALLPGMLWARIGQIVGGVVGLTVPRYNWSSQPILPAPAGPVASQSP